MLTLMTLLSVGWPGPATGSSEQPAHHVTSGLQPPQTTSLVCGTTQPCPPQVETDPESADTPALPLR
jgi:hypothetical protein